MRIQTTIETLSHRLSNPKMLLGASAFRLLAGSTILYQYLINYAQRHLLFGPQGGLYPFWFLEGRGFWSLYAYSDAVWYFEVLYHAGLLVTAAWTLGYLGRLGTLLTYLLWLSIRARFPELWDGGDNAMELMLPFALFARVDCRLRLAGPREAPSGVAAVLHNAAILCIVLQLCVIYLVAGLTKVHGDTWWNGTALYYALRDSEFLFPGVSEHIFRSDWVVTLLSYSTVWFQISFPFLVFLNAKSRLVAVLIAISFHLSIAIVLGLNTFGFFMIACELSLVTDAEYAVVARTLGHMTLRLRRRLPSVGDPSGA